jgi:hypothetical protein
MIPSGSCLTVVVSVLVLLTRPTHAIIDHIMPACAKPGMHLGATSGGALGGFGAAAYTGLLSTCPGLLPHLTMASAATVTMPGLMIGGPLAPLAAMLAAGVLGGALIGGTAGSLISCREIGVQNDSHFMVQFKKSRMPDGSDGFDLELEDEAGHGYKLRQGFNHRVHPRPGPEPDHEMLDPIGVRSPEKGAMERFVLPYNIASQLYKMSLGGMDAQEQASLRETFVHLAEAEHSNRIEDHTEKPMQMPMPDHMHDSMDYGFFPIRGQTSQEMAASETVTAKELNPSKDESTKMKNHPLYKFYGYRILPESPDNASNSSGSAAAAAVASEQQSVRQDANQEFSRRSLGLVHPDMAEHIRKVKTMLASQGGILEGRKERSEEPESQEKPMSAKPFRPSPADPTKLEENRQQTKQP